MNTSGTPSNAVSNNALLRVGDEYAKNLKNCNSYIKNIETVAYDLSEEKKLCLDKTSQERVRARPEGTGRREWKTSGIQYARGQCACTCICGKAPGIKHSRREIDLWLRLHKKKCKVIKKDK